jgi:hypothetical protein
MLCSAATLTFGNTYGAFILFSILFEIAIIFKNMENAILKNNLTHDNRPDDFIKVRNQANTVYSMATMIIAFTISYLFNLNQYLPMYLMIAACVATFAMSFFIRDITEQQQSPDDKNKETAFKMSKRMLAVAALVLSAYALFYGTIDLSQTNGKLLIQEELNGTLELGVAVGYLGIIVAISRVARVISNLSFTKIYSKMRNRVGPLLILLLSCSLAVMLAGFLAPLPFALKIILMSFGLITPLAVRDAFRDYIYDLVLKNCGKNQQQKALSYLQLARKVGTIVIGLLALLLLINYPLVAIIMMLFVVSLIEFGICLKLYRIVNG